ncbi:type Z 30S ribosomal protein S14 [Candidatus Collierbacteria bacterium]|nr:type Z 30S ribosomal protein S14 [Candidatus Collierbacteria bacterium]
MAKKSKINKTIKLKNHPTRHANRCQLCGRPRGFIRLFGLCRLCFRQLVSRGELPGVYKESK